ncbi:MAG: reductase [Burkholderiaceae bacterium]
MSTQTQADTCPLQRPTAGSAASDSKAEDGPGLGFAPEHDQPVRYIDRTRSWYLTLGYGTPYTWAHYIDVPFSRLRGSLAQARASLITTAAPYQPDKGPQGPGAPFNASAKFHEVYSGDTSQPHDLRISHVGIDRKHADMADSNCWFPLPALQRAAAAGTIGEVAPRFHGLPTDRSQRRTLEVHAPELLARLQADAVDAVVLVPNCPVCHQSCSLVARYLESHGIATVVLGAARDIVEYCGVPRLVFNDFPLGNAAGRPGDTASQTLALALALQLLEHAPAARTTVQTALRWSDDPSWKLDYLNAERFTPEERVQIRAENERANSISAAARQAAAAR